MKPVVSKFKVHEEFGHNKFWANVATENVLLAAYPETRQSTDITGKVMDVIHTALPSLTSGNTPFIDELKRTGRTKTIDTDTVDWKVKTDGKILPIATRKIETSLTPGIQASMFTIELNTNAFVEGDVIAPYNALDLEVRVARDGVTNGLLNTEYTVQYLGNPEGYFPPEFLEPMMQWCKTSSAYGEASSGYGSFHFNGTGWIEFSSDLSDVAKKARVTNKANNLMLKFSPCDKSGNRIEEYPEKIITKIEAEFIKANAWEQEMTVFYGRSAGKNIIDSTSGYRVRRGPGIKEFLEDGNDNPYPLYGGSLDLFEDYFQSFDFDTTPYGQRNRVIGGGQGFITLWNRWASERYAMSSVPNKYEDHVYSTKGIGDTKGLGLNQVMFTETKIFPFGSIRVEHWPILDNKEINGGILHPDTGLPMSSYEAYYIDRGPMGEDANILFLERDKTMVYTHLCGVWSPAGGINTKAASKAGFTSSHGGRYYDLLYANTFGVVIKNMSKVHKFTPDYVI